MTNWQESTHYCPKCREYGHFVKLERTLLREKGIWKYRHGCGYKQTMEAAQWIQQL